MPELAQNYAEYQDSAPQLVPPVPAAANGMAKGVDGPDSGVPISDGEKKGKKSSLGLMPIIALVSLAVLILVGIIVGVVVGTQHKTHHPAAIQSTSASTSATSTTSSATPSPTALAIIEAVYSAVNETVGAISAMQQGPYLSINMSNTSPWGSPDPWPNNRKCLALLHAFGTSIRTFVACDGDGAFTLVPGNVSLSPDTQEITRQGPSSADFALVSVVWGGAEIRDEGVYETLFKYKSNGSAVPFENWLFGQDTLKGWGKSGAIWYTTDNFATFESIVAREHDSVPF